MTRRRRLCLDVALAMGSGLLLILCYPTIHLDWLVWVSLAPLLAAIEKRSIREAFVLCHIAGVTFMSGVFYWIWTIEAYNIYDYLTLQVLYLPLYFSLWGASLIFLRAKTGSPTALLAASLWVGFEYIRSHLGFLSFPWMLLGHSQYQQPWLIQMASITGVFGL
jgi:apolipoprotein N-acyltransferase